jgi:hypothetical protein
MTSPNIIVSNVTGLTSLIFNGIITNNYGINTVLYIKISKLVNPLSYKSSSSFQISTSYNGYVIEQLNTGLAVTMNVMAAFN